MNFTPEKKLGFGLMRLPQNSADAADIDLEQVKQMVDFFLEKASPTLIPPGCTTASPAKMQ